LLGASRPSAEVAVYGALYKLPSIFTTVSWAVCIASLPGFALAFGHGIETLRASVERNVRVLLALLTPLLVLLAVEAPTALSIVFGPAFVVGVGALRILLGSVALALVSGSVLYGLTASGRMHAFTLAAAAGAAVNVVFDLLTVPTLGMNAAAWGTVLAEAAVLAGAWLLGRDVAARSMLSYAARITIAGVISFLVASTLERASPVAAALVALGLYGGLAAALRIWDPIDGVLGRRFRELLSGRERIDGS
jgi:O-antigen/teichoic acid export membrane protein